MTALSHPAALASRTGARPAAVRRVDGVGLAVRWDRVALLLVGLLIAAWVVAGAAVGASQADTPAADPVVVVVQPGDTLWALARDHAPADVATLEYVMQVERLNGVRAGVLLPGTALRLPQG